ALVRERADTVHIRKIASEVLELEPVFDVVRHRGGTIHAGNDRDVIPRSNASAGTSVALEGAHLFRRVIVHRPGSGAKIVVAGKIPHFEIVSVHVIAGRDVSFGKPDGLSIFSDGRAVRDRIDRYLVA